MTAAAIYEASAVFLEADVLATVNGAYAGLLAPGAVTAARSSHAKLARRDKPHATTVEIVYVARREKPEGLDQDRVELDFDLRCTVRRKDQSAGKDQARL